MSWTERATATQFKIEPLIAGRYRPSDSTDFISCINPAFETPLCEFLVGSSSDVDEAVRVARKAFENGCWSQMSPAKRADILYRLADLIIEHKAEIALLDTLEMGKPICASLQDAESFAPSRIRGYARLAESLLGVSAPIGVATLALNTYEPRGVVGAITPWNFPIVNAVIKVAPALIAGNSVVLKPSELTPSSALKLAELALEAGVPEGVFNVVPGLGSTVGAALALHSQVDLLSFTGSTATGRKLLELSGQSNGKPLLLECGGKSSQLVFDDVRDLDRVADATVESVLWNQGQVCSARTRLLVHEAIEEDLLERIVRRLKTCKPGNPLDESTTFGPLASAAQRDRVKAYVASGIRAGADPILQGAIRESGGCYVSPTIFARVKSGMAIAREEIFGPVLCVQSFSTESEAIALANDTPYGLAATVWTQHMGRARRLARAIKAGDVQVRTAGEEWPEVVTALGHEPQKASGFGVEIGVKGLHSYSTLKSITFKGA